MVQDHPLEVSQDNLDKSTPVSKDDVKTDSPHVSQYCASCLANILIDDTPQGFLCKGPCGRWFHFNCKNSKSSSKKKSKRKKKSCIKSKSPVCTCHINAEHEGQENGHTPPESNVLPDVTECEECSSRKFKCSICKTHDDNVKQCSYESCQRWYHTNCFRVTDPYQISTYDNEIKGLATGQFHCPVHYCLTCYIEHADDSVAASKESLVQCLSCPSGYHYNDDCLPAGSWDIGSNFILCPDHLDRTKHPCVNFQTCFICMEIDHESPLLSCETCPASCHLKCLDYDIDALHKKTQNSEPTVAEGQRKFSCSTCIRRKPLHYGEIVWSKIGVYRWWPAKILPPDEVPENIWNWNTDVGEFAIRFLGSNDYHYSHKGRSFSYSGDDALESGELSSLSVTKQSNLAKSFRKGLIEAKAEYKNYMETRLTVLSKRAANIKPKYNRIQVNKPVGRLAESKSLGKIFGLVEDDFKCMKNDSSWKGNSRKPASISRKRCSLENSAVTEKCHCKPTSSVAPAGDGQQVDKKLPCHDETCVNRALYTECTPSNCSSGADGCGNRRFKNRTYPKLKMFYTGMRGWGLKTLQDIKEGDFVIEYVGELIYEDEASQRIEQSLKKNETNFYHLTLHKNIVIDAGPSGNLARFINHSCDPNCNSQKWTVGNDYRIGLFARRNIPSGTELTFNYYLAIHGSSKTPCHCGALTCSGFIGEKPAKVLPKTPTAKDTNSRKRKTVLTVSNKKKRTKSTSRQTPSPSNNSESQ